MNAIFTLFFGVLITAIGAWGLYNPGGTDILSAANIFLGGMLIGLGVALKIVTRTLF